ncbi:GNAT family N-acetyltransferase [Salinibacter sp. 10B]|uniref:GNAT family N-acetyltransferase n=1 Tax=Salinibacter sp. 10B TaxID=1923971 RepID=UPI000CF3ADA9|nr:GNAT family N-acetyltransferase [Salinibacter sp. 10B]PQJ34633.1 GNAT family N-acetyltransferase [Salinibacter sp. 10B]
MADKIIIRRATREDADTIAHFNRQMAEETEGKSLDRETVRNGVQALFADPSRGFYLVAVRDERIVGSLMITTEWSDWRNGTFWWIQSVYVRPEARRSGVYRALHRAVRRQARDVEEVCGLRLYVERGNEAARETYEAMGMTETSYRMYEEML